LDRRVEHLPSGEEMALRRGAGAGLTRPEAAVLLALAKFDFAQSLEQSPLVSDPATYDAVAGYFPVAVAARFGELIASHRLYPQLAATRVASEIVDRMGVTWAHETAEEFGVALGAVGGAYWAARHVLAADQRWREVETLAATVSADTEGVLHSLVAAAVDRLARHYLVAATAPVAADREVVRALEVVVGPGAGNPASLMEMGVAAPAAAAFARLPTLARTADIGVVVRTRAIAAPEVLAMMQSIDDALGLSAFRGALDRLAVTSRWGRWQVRRLQDDVSDLRRRAVLAATGGDLTVAGWLATPAVAAAAARFTRLAAVLRDPEADGHAVAALAVRALTDLVGG
jgi:glutamate dehydrogenase